MPVKFKSEVSLDALNNATVDTDKILVSDNGIVKYRTGTEIRTDIGAGVGSVTSVGLTMPVAFSVANSPITSSGNLEVSAAGLASQYIRGDGQLATLPASGGGGGSSVFYYLNGSIAASVATYKQMSNTPVVGTGTDFNLTGNGLIAQFLTDIGNPNRIQIPGGAWNFEMFFNMSSVGGNTKFYVELLKYNGATFTSIGSSITVPEEITGGTNTDLYLTSIAVPETVLLTTDRLAIRVYIIDNSGGRTVTLHTEDNTLCQITTTFSAGVTSLNGLTENTQYLAVGTGGSDFNISSVLDTHTFNLPTASSTKRGALSITDWLIFNSKISGSGTANYIPKFTAIGTTIGNSLIYDNGSNVGIGTTAPSSKLTVTSSTNEALYVYSSGGTGATLGASDYRALYAINNSVLNPTIYAINIGAGPILSLFNNSATNVFHVLNNGNVGIGTTAPTEKLEVNGNALIKTAFIGTISAFGDNYASFSQTSRAGTTDYSLLSENNGATYLNASLVQSIKFRIGNFDKAIIDSNGNFGIGTTIPTQKLHVEGNLKVTGTILDSNNSAGTLGQILSSTSTGTDWVTLSEIAGVDGTGTANYVSKWLDGNTITNSSIYDNGTNVGIGTTSPMAVFDVKTSSDKHISFRTNGESEIFAANDGGLAYTPLYFNASKYSFGTGNVGIGTTIPSGQFEIFTSPYKRFLIDYPSIYKTSLNFGTAGILSYDAADANLSLYATDIYGNIRFGTANTERMRIDSIGNVGIGTTNPTTGNLVISPTTANGTVQGISILFHPDGALSRERVKLWINDFNGQLDLKDSGEIKTVQIASLGNSYFNGGNVGIGTTSPYEKLDVDGNIRLGNYTTAGTRYIGYGNNTFASEFIAGMSIQSTTLGGNYSQKLNFVTHVYGVGAGVRMTIAEAGNVGIGTTSPGTKLQINVAPTGNQDDGMRVTDGTRLIQTNIVGDTYNYRSVGPNETMLYSTGNPLNIVSDGQPIKFTAGTSESMRITSSGNVGIGTTSPLTKLQVEGQIRVNNSITGLTLNRPTVTNYNGLGFLTNGSGQWFFGMRENLSSNNLVAYSEVTASDVLTLNVSNNNAIFTGNVGIGTTSPAAKLEVVGNINITNNFIAYPEMNISGANGGFINLKTNGNLRGFLYGNDGGLSLGSEGARNIDFYTNGSQKAIITSSGNVGIGTTSPAATAILDLSSTTQGFLPPRMTQGQRNAIVSPEIGLCVYCIDGYDGLYVYKATGWWQVA